MDAGDPTQLERHRSNAAVRGAAIGLVVALVSLFVVTLVEPFEAGVVEAIVAFTVLPLLGALSSHLGARREWRADADTDRVLPGLPHEQTRPVVIREQPGHHSVEPAHRAKAARLGGTRVALLLAALVVLAGPFALLLALVEAGWQPLLEVDRGVATGLNELLVDHENVVFATQVLTDLGGSTTWWLLLSAATGYLLLRKQPRLALFVAVTGLGGGLLNLAVKAAVGRARPEFAEPVSYTDGFAFPSGHTMSSAIGVTVLLVVLLPLLAPRWRRPAVVVGAIFAISVGLSRIVLGVHWVSDVLGGWLLAIVWLLMMAALFRPWTAELWTDKPAHRQPNRSR